MTGSDTTYSGLGEPVLATSARRVTPDMTGINMRSCSHASAAGIWNLRRPKSQLPQVKSGSWREPSHPGVKPAFDSVGALSLCAMPDRWGYQLTEGDRAVWHRPAESSGASHDLVFVHVVKTFHDGYAVRPLEGHFNQIGSIVRSSAGGEPAPKGEPVATEVDRESSSPGSVVVVSGDQLELLPASFPS